MTETMGEIEREIDNGKEPEQIEIQIDPETDRIVEFHRDTEEKVAF